MKRLAVALSVGVAVFGTVWAIAATLEVGWTTLATGSGTVGSCGDVTGATYVLKGQNVTLGDKSGDQISGQPTDITTVKAVNIETGNECVIDSQGVQVYAEVRDGSGNRLSSGTCQVSSKGGVSFNEADDDDNVPGCTAWFDNPGDVSVAAVEELVVTMT